MLLLLKQLDFACDLFLQGHIIIYILKITVYYNWYMYVYLVITMIVTLCIWHFDKWIYIMLFEVKGQIVTRLNKSLNIAQKGMECIIGI